jgi:hypothetical protein
MIRKARLSGSDKTFMELSETLERRLRKKLKIVDLSDLKPSERVKRLKKTNGYCGIGFKQYDWILQ